MSRRAKPIAVIAVLLACSLLTLRLQCQPDGLGVTPSTRRFDVATIKPGERGDRTGIVIRGNRWISKNITLEDVVKYACGVHAVQIVGAPDWFAREHFDIEGIPETTERPTPEAFKEMVKALLVDRFHLQAHRASSDLPAYLLVQDAQVHLESSERPDGSIPSVSYVEGWLAGWSASGDDIASFLQRFAADRPVVNRSGLTGRYDFALHFSTSAQLAHDADETEYPGLTTAIREQLGLKLQSVKTTVVTLVIDHLEHPTEN